MTKNAPLRIIDGNMAPHQPFWRVRDQAETESGETEIEFFGPISEYSWFGDEITPAMFKSDLKTKGKDGPVTLLIDSPGGDTMAASVIRSMLQEYPGKVTADIVGMAASAATIVTTGADHVRMRESGLFLIHDPSTLAYGNIEEIKAALDLLITVKDAIVDVYETKTGLEREKIAKMMSNETWMTAREAADYGFVDEVVKGSIRKGGANNRITPGFANCLRDYQHLPETLQNLLRSLDTSADPQPVQPQMSEAERRLRAEIQLVVKGSK